MPTLCAMWIQTSSEVNVASLKVTQRSPRQGQVSAEGLQASPGGHALTSIPLGPYVLGGGTPVAQRHPLDSWLGFSQSPGR